MPSNSAQVPSWAGTDERMLAPGAVTSGFISSETGVGPPDENDAIAPLFVPAAAVIASGAEPGEPTEPGPSAV